MSIYVQIAAYRDPQLIPTIENLLDTAKYPDKLRIGICRQFHPNDKFDDLSAYRMDERFRIIDVPHKESQGVCWARYLTQKNYGGEDFTLQIDSHMRFIQHWDERMIDMIRDLQRKNYPKPVLTGYPAGFDPGQEFVPSTDSPGLQMNLEGFSDKGIMCLSADVIPNWEQLDSPVPARFFSAGFCFTLGKFCEEVPYDPELYFYGEEMSMTVRAYTNNYDLFHPHRMLVWHHYAREGMPKHWDDHRNWYVREEHSIMKVKHLLSQSSNGHSHEPNIYGLGKCRSLRDYEKYAGIHIAGRAIQAFTMAKMPPPDPVIYESEQHWFDSLSVLKAG